MTEASVLTEAVAAAALTGIMVLCWFLRLQERAISELRQDNARLWARVFLLTRQVTFLRDITDRNAELPGDDPFEEDL